jgi:hypothetical protein
MPRLWGRSEPCMLIPYQFAHFFVAAATAAGALPDLLRLNFLHTGEMYTSAKSRFLITQQQQHSWHVKQFPSAQLVITHVIKLALRVPSTHTHTHTRTPTPMHTDAYSHASTHNTHSSNSRSTQRACARRRRYRRAAVMEGVC